MKTQSKLIALLVLVAGLPALADDAPPWKPVAGKMMTRWAKDVSPENVHPEYPRPQMARKAWQNLNGLWDYAIKPLADAQPAAFDGKILVPFPVESALSGVAKPVSPEQKLWYRRTFKVDAAWRERGKRVLLHFGAVDWQTTVWVNGKEVVTHRGGYDPFSADITDALKGGDGEEEIVVGVVDPTSASWQPRGKQVLKPGGIFYTATTGIWQTVWLEPVPKKHIETLEIVPDLDKNRVTVTVHDAGANRDVVDVNDYGLAVFDDDGKSINGGNGGPNSSLVVNIDQPRLWTPDSPHLYRIRVRANGDEVESYFAMRKISLGKDEKGITRMMLNNKFVFQYGPLDQGFWPDGLYTAPTDEALKYDLEVTKKLGFNMVRKHVKVEPETWYRHCDEMGLLVWQDMPAGDKGIGGKEEDLKRSKESADDYEREWAAIIAALSNHPCIVMWVPFNEGWGQYDTARIVELTRKLDPTRLVDNASGWADRGVGDVHDMHNYPGPGAFKPEPTRASVLGEFGGLGLPVKGHSWQDEKNWGYRSFTSADALTETYVQLLAKMHPLIGDPGLSAAVYTQTTDCETEVNGLMTYDRAIIKMDEKRAGDAARKLYTPPPVTTTLLPDARSKEMIWKYTLDKPANGWEKSDADDAAWKSGPAGFGTNGTPGATVRTEWKTNDIWVRRSFDAPENLAAATVYLVVHHDDDAEIYLNGILAATLTGYTSEYSMVPLRPEAAKALKAGKNVIAIHCHQNAGGQYIDAGVVEVK